MCRERISSFLLCAFAIGLQNYLTTLVDSELLNARGFSAIFAVFSVIGRAWHHLTTIAQPIASIGQSCMAQLLQRIQQPDKPPAQIMLPVELIERASCQSLEKQDGREKSQVLF